MRYLLISILFLLSSKLILGQQLQTGEVQYPEYGIQFVIPQGWFGKETNEGYAMQSKTQTGTVLLFVNELKTLEAIKEEFSQSLNDENVFLQPENKIEVKVNYVKQYYSGTADGEQVKVLAYGYLNPYGKSITTMIVAKTKDFSSNHEAILQEVNNSIKFTKPAVNQDFNAAICTRDLSGYQLKYEKYTYSGGGVGGVSGSNSVSRQINLCSTGIFTYYGGSNVSVESDSSHGHSGGTSEGHGTWEFVDEDGKVYLVLNYYDEDFRYYEVTYDKDGGAYLDNTRYYLVDVSCNR